MGILVLVFIFIFLAQHGDAHGPDSCNRGGGLCRVGTCVSGEYPAQFCFEPVILCCKNLSPTSTES
ncbi:GLL12 protein, partial [Leiothrix lutea]|nr:GLL12 protein [Leiothrix lutea]